MCDVKQISTTTPYCVCLLTGLDSVYYAGGNGGGYTRSGYSGLNGFGNGVGGYYSGGYNNNGLSNGGGYTGLISSSYPTYNRNVGYTSPSTLTTNYNPQSGYYY